MGKSPSTLKRNCFESVIRYEEDSTIASELRSQKEKGKWCHEWGDMEYHEVPEQLIELQIMEKANCGYALGYVYGGIEKR